MPTDIMKETDRIRFPNNINDGLNQKFLEIKSIWQETNVDYEKKSMDFTTYSDYIQEAQTDGFIVGLELENVKAKSRRSLMQQMSNHISINFQSLYGKENNGVRQNYFQIGVRVPTKEHVSEIVGKQGLKIKEIREKTGALIITPGECEDHVFIIEALPGIALTVARLIKDRANEITINRQRENNQKVSLLMNISNRFGTVKPYNAISSLRPILATGIIEVPKNIVGRIIGTHGSIITTIQKDTGTEIRSPPKDNNPSHNNCKAKFEILVYQRNNTIDVQEAVQRIKNAKQLIAHVAMHQMERIRAEESPFSNYRLKSISSWEKNLPASDGNVFADKEKLLNYQMQSISWLWTDIDRLEDQMADEVVLRILEESKKKSKLHSDYKIYDATATMSIDRYEELPAQSVALSPYKQINSYNMNGFEISQFPSTIYNENTPILKSSTSTISLNSSRIMESSNNQFSAPSAYLGRCNSNSSSNNNNNNNNNNATDNLANSIAGSANELDLTQCSLAPVSSTVSKSPVNPINTKSYADNFKAFNTANPTTIIAAAAAAAAAAVVSSPPHPNNPSIINSTSSIFFNTFCNNHGAIGDHIRKLNMKTTAQFQQ